MQWPVALRVSHPSRSKSLTKALPDLKIARFVRSHAQTDDDHHRRDDEQRPSHPSPPVCNPVASMADTDPTLTSLSQPSCGPSWVSTKP